MAATLTITYRSASMLAFWAGLLLLAEGFIAAVGALPTAAQLQLLDAASLGGSVPVEQALAQDHRQCFFAVLCNGVGLVAVVLFCVWIYRASRNAGALGAVGMKYGPGWSVGWFFVPFASLFMPFLVLRELW